MKKIAQLFAVALLMITGCSSKPTGVVVPPIPVMTMGDTEHYSGRDTDSLVFSGRAGEGNPLVQELYIRSMQNQNFKWSVSKKSNWLSITPLFGMAPTKISFTCNIAGMSVGTYRDTVVFRSKETSNTTKLLHIILCLSPPPPPPVYIDMRPYMIPIGEEGFFKEFTDGFRIDYSGNVTINSKQYFIYSTSDTSFSDWLFDQEKLAGFISSIYDTVILDSCMALFPESLHTEQFFMATSNFKFNGEIFGFGYDYSIVDTNTTVTTTAGAFSEVMCLQAEFGIWTDYDLPVYVKYKVYLAPDVGAVKFEFTYPDWPVREFKSGFVNGIRYGSP